MKILLTGAKGQLGRALYNLFTKDDSKWEVVAVDKAQLDITNLEQVSEVLAYYRPEIVINCGAYTAVDDCEENEEIAYLVNAEGPHHLAQVCNELHITLVHISTDYVFDGGFKEPIKEETYTMPQTVYGKSKCLGEEYVKTLCDKYFIVRTAWLYGEGSNFVKTMLRLAKERKEINVVNDQWGSPTSTKDLASFISELIQTDYYGIYHASNEGICSWYEFALTIFEYAGEKVIVNPITSEEYVCKAVRPKYSVLDCSKLRNRGFTPLRTWDSALKEYIEEWKNEARKGQKWNILK